MVSLNKKKNNKSLIYSFSIAASSSSTLTTSSINDEIIKPMTVNFQQRPSTTHGPMIYRMTSVNPSMFLTKKVFF
jgi:hypothetical protein